jgi:hypothetical protein
MKKYEVPVMKLHQLKSGSILQDSGKENFDRSAANTQAYEIDGDFDSKNFFEN